VNAADAAADPDEAIKKFTTAGREAKAAVVKTGTTRLRPVAAFR
jgi:hypothetical protein